MAEAYGYAIGKCPPPEEWILIGYLDRFGAEATFGRQPRPEEMRRMLLVENVITGYRESKRATSLAEWIKNNRASWEILKEATDLWQMLK